MRKLMPVMMCCMVVATGASAQNGDIVATGGDGSILSLTPQTLYRAFGDRIVNGNDVIGNNAADWNRVDPSLPSGRIELDLPDGSAEARILDAVRAGCRMAGGAAAACDRVGLRRDRIVRRGGYFDGGTLGGTFAGGRAATMAPILDTVDAMIEETVGTVRAEDGRAVMQPIRSPADDLVEARASDPSTSGITSTPLPPLAPAPPPPPLPPSAPPVVSPAPESAPLPVPVPVDAPAAMAAPSPLPTAKPATAAPPAETAAAAPPPRATVGSAGPGRVYASRLFTGREGFPPEAFAAYGIVAFSTLATSQDRDVYMAICEAFFSALINSGDIAADASEQMVTVWPIDDRRRPDLVAGLNTTRAQEGSCENAVEYYDVQVARGAIGDAMQAGAPLSGRGPFLLAWAPAGMKGSPDAVVLAADLSDVKTVSDAKDVLRIWREDIEQDPELWQGGFSAEKVRVKLRLIVDRYGEGLLRFLGG